ncbi:MAG: aspartyl protease family protein [Hyphomonadaceae bacterium]|nr:aspartyl protease family protein [Hyphomonadaceae bacterium]
MRARAGVVGAAAMVLVACGSLADAQGPATIELDMSAPRPTAQLQIGQEPPVTAIFDTGAAGSILRLDYAQRLDLPRQGAARAAGVGGRPVEGFRTTISGSLGGAQFDSSLAVALDIPLPLPGIDAIISPNVFAGRLVRFDFTAARAQVLPRDAANTPRVAAVPYMGEDSHGRINRTPAVEVLLPNGQTVMAMADTGALGGLRLPLAMAEQLTLLAQLEPRDPVRMIGREIPAFTGRVSGVVRVGPLELRDPEVIFIDSTDHPSVVGFDVLRQGVLVLDPLERRSWFLLG